MKRFPGETAVQFEWRYQQALKRDKEYWENHARFARYGPFGDHERDPKDVDEDWSELAQSDAESRGP